MIIVYTTGVFDMLHPGHLNILRRARALGDRLVVGIQDDESVAKQKNKKPIMNCAERITMLESLPFVDVVFSYSNLDQRRILELMHPDIMVQGEDWQKTDDRKKILKFLKENNIRLIQFPYTKNISTTEIKMRINNN